MNYAPISTPSFEQNELVPAELDAFKKCRCCIDRQIGDAVLGVSVVYVQNRWPVNVLTELAAELVQRNLRIPLCRLHLFEVYCLPQHF